MYKLYLNVRVFECQLMCVSLNAEPVELLRQLYEGSTGKICKATHQETLALLRAVFDGEGLGPSDPSETCVVI